MISSKQASSVLRIVQVGFRACYVFTWSGLISQASVRPSERQLTLVTELGLDSVIVLVRINDGSRLEQPV